MGGRLPPYTEAYYKQLSDVDVYDVDNVKIRYAANNDAKAYATALKQGCLASW